MEENKVEITESDQMESTITTHQVPKRRQKGGIITMPFIIGKHVLCNMQTLKTLFSFRMWTGFTRFYWFFRSLYIAANESFERVASFGLIPNMIVYLMTEYNLGLTKGNNILYLWAAASNFMPILGAFLSDSYLGRFLTIGLGSIVSVLVSLSSILFIFSFGALL